MRAIQRLTLVSLLAGIFIGGCESGSSDNPAPITFTPAPAPAGTGFVALYAPPVDVVPYPNESVQPDGHEARGAHEDQGSVIQITDTSVVQ